MNPLIASILVLNLVFTLREFFAVWEHMDKTKTKNRVPELEDYFEFFFAGGMISLTTFALLTIYFR
jgi:hypothetical protein